MDFLIPLSSDENSDALALRLLDTNEKAAENALCLSDADAKMLAVESFEAIRLHDRIEIGESAVVLLTEKFSQSTYISQENYADTVAELLDVLYEARDETHDMLSDEALIDIMFKFFESSSFGDVDYLRGNDMQRFYRDYLNKASGY